MNRPYTRVRTVRPEDIDQFGHVNNLVWLRFALELATAHSSAAGWDEARYVASEIMWIVHRHEIDYLRPAYAGDELCEETWIELIRGARCIRAFRFSRGEERVAEGRTTWVLTRTTTSRACRIPPALIEAFPTASPAE